MNCFVLNQKNGDHAETMHENDPVKSNIQAIGLSFTLYRREPDSPPCSHAFPV